MWALAPSGLGSTRRRSPGLVGVTLPTRRASRPPTTASIAPVDRELFERGSIMARRASGEWMTSSRYGSRLPGPSGRTDHSSRATVPGVLCALRRFLSWRRSVAAKSQSPRAKFDPVTASCLAAWRASDAGLRPDPFPNRAASLLPGLLAATRTGLAPAGDDELMLDQLLNQHLQLWAHPRQVVSSDAGGVHSGAPRAA
jgi:hypothetical protein